jgi:hypothetical protein
LGTDKKTRQSKEEMIEKYVSDTPKPLKSDEVLIRKVVTSAIQKAERFKTLLVIKSSSGRILEVTPAQMKRLISGRKK